jgi:hypothetical protein
LESEVRREAVSVAFERLVELFRRHAVASGEIGVENDALAANRENERFDGFAWEFG